MFFIVVDAHSKWPEVMSTTTSEKTIEVLRSLFAHHGLSEKLVSNNGPQFTSAEFKQFLEGKVLNTSSVLLTIQPQMVLPNILYKL